MKKLFAVSEKQLAEFLFYVPISNKNLGVESPVIYNIMMSLGPQIEPLMAKIIELIDPKKLPQNFSDYYDHLNRDGVLKMQSVITREAAMNLSPFNDRNPIWWQAYNNHIKHQLPAGMEKATLDNLLKMHSSVFILHCIANAALRLEDKNRIRLLNASMWRELNWHEIKIMTSTQDLRLWSGRTSEEYDLELMHDHTDMQSEIVDNFTVLSRDFLSIRKD